jgi:hypothetical protein
MTKEKITLNLDDLHTPEVEERVRQQEALAKAQANSQRMASVPSRLPLDDPSRGSIWYNAFFNLTVFGLFGGLLAFGCGELVQYLNPNQRTNAVTLMQAREQLTKAYLQDRISGTSLNQSLMVIDRKGHDNPWYQLLSNSKMSDAERDAQKESMKKRDRLRDLLGNICFYSACGVLIAVALGMAESVAARNLQGAVVYGGVGALLGLVGGVIVSLFIEKLYNFILGESADQAASMGRNIAARAVSWGVLGLFLSAAPGVVMRNGRKLAFGLIGGFIGGTIGGALFDPIGRLTRDAAHPDGNAVLSRLIAIVSIGVITGVGTALVENVAKQGWFRVIRGLIAGKQFIIYRNPTFIGSSPQCEIYLFKDAKVGRRHAALHISPAGYDIEDLGTGTGTFINGRPIDRTRLRGGDQVQVGETCFTFQEKAKH